MWGKDDKRPCHRYVELNYQSELSHIIYYNFQHINNRKFRAAKFRAVKKQYCPKKPGQLAGLLKLHKFSAFSVSTFAQNSGSSPWFSRTYGKKKRNCPIKYKMVGKCVYLITYWSNKTTHSVTLTHEVFVVDGEYALVRWEVDPQRLHDGTAGRLGVVEQRIPVRQQAVAHTHGLSYHAHVLLGQ